MKREIAKAKELLRMSAQRRQTELAPLPESPPSNGAPTGAELPERNPTTLVPHRDACS